MAKVTSRTVRVAEIPLDVDEDTFREVAKRLSQSIKGRWPFPSQPGDPNPKISLASQLDDQVGTITLPSEEHKNMAFKTHYTDWTFDDKFNGITILYSIAEPDLDICAVHGLNGNAFESWVANTNHKMWLRDLLPLSKPFDQARIMTFGYSSQLSDRANLSGINEWAHHLLASVSSVRASQKERQRPILFICHSMGGLVARQAMIRLNDYSHKSEYQGIDLKYCGLLFLSTPHSGSTEADWNTFLVDVAGLAWGVRSEILDALRAFNPMSAESQEDFANMKCHPPFDAFYETQTTSFAKLNCHVVTRQSASLNGQIASPMLDVDHNTICKFEGKFGGFVHVTEKLRHLKSLLLKQTSVVVPSSNKPWLPPPTALNCFHPPGKRFFEGRGLRQNGKLQGRQAELQSLKELVAKRNDKGNAAFAITGIGGIGKTATLLEIARQQINQRNIFFIHANDAKSLHQAYLHIARRVGPEYLLKEYRGQDLQGVWNNETAEEKVELFKAWLEDPENVDTLFLFDDLDGIKDLEKYSEIQEAALPREAKNILFTTRNPVFREAHRSRHDIRLDPMSSTDLIKVMEEIRCTERSDLNETADLCNSQTLLDIANAVHGHPLAASIAIKYIIRVQSQVNGSSAGQDFVNMLRGADYESRRRFLEFKPQMSSIMETFHASRERLSDPDGRAWKLMQILSILETDESVVDFREFFFGADIDVNNNKFPGKDVLRAKQTELSELLYEIEAVSFGERLGISKPFRFHPLWLECARHVMEKGGRIMWIRQVLMVCYYSINREGGDDEGGVERRQSLFYPHVRHCLGVCRSFRMEVEQLGLEAEFMEMVEQLKGEVVESKPY